MEIQTQKITTETATEIALRSHVDDVFLIRRGVFKLKKGKYGGWLLRPPLEELDAAYGVWCYGVEERDADEDVMKNKDIQNIQEKVAKVASSLGVNKTPSVRLVLKKFRVVKAVRKKTTERYSVYDIMPDGREAVATLAYVHYYVWWSRRGKCHGELCSILDKFSKLLKAEFKEGAEVGDAGVYVPYDVSALAELIEKLREESKEEEETAKAEEGGEARSGDGTYFIVVKLPPGSEDVVAKLEEAVRQKLKELNITAAVWSVRADL